MDFQQNSRLHSFCIVTKALLQYKMNEILNSVGQLS